jgi:hypothetical protein
VCQRRPVGVWGSHPLTKKEPSFFTTAYTGAENREGEWTGNTQNARQRTTINSIEITGRVLKSVLNSPIFRLIFGVFTYEKRRGRESNPRIAVLQTATLPLGYPADGEKMQTIPIWRLGVNVRRQFENRSII